METENTHEKYRAEIAVLREIVDELRAKVADLVEAVVLKRDHEDMPYSERINDVEAENNSQIDSLDRHLNEFQSDCRKRIEALTARVRACEDQLPRLDAHLESIGRHGARLDALEEQAARPIVSSSYQAGEGNSPPQINIPVDKIVTAWADGQMLDALEAWGANENARTSIMEERVSQEALRDCIGDAICYWAKELALEYQPPAEADKVRIAEVAPAIAAKPRDLAAEVVKRMDIAGYNQRLKDHWHVVAQY